MVTRALLQNEGGSAEASRPKIRAPLQSAAAAIHSTSIHRVGNIARPNQARVAMPAPARVEPTSIRPAERAPVAPACWPSSTDLMMADR